MATTRLYLDARAVKPGQAAPVKVRISHGGTMSLMSTGVAVLPEQWDAATGCVIAHDRRRTLNVQLASLKSVVDDAIFDLRRTGRLSGMTAADVKRYAEGRVPADDETKPLLFIDALARTRDAQRTEGSRAIFVQTERRLRAFDAELDNRSFDDIDKDYLQRFDAFLAQTNSRNSRNVYYRTIRTAFNSAIDDELTTCYPFRKFKIRAEATRDKALSVSDLRYIFNLELPPGDWRQEYVDMFKLSFLLIGINVGDLAALQSVQSGRIEYQRAKTHKHYSVAVLPEAQAIIDRYRGTSRLLSFADRYADHHDFTHHLNKALKAIGLTYSPGLPPSGRPMFPTLSSGYARTTWATIATELDIPRETISAALGHSVVDVTATYIRLSWRKKIDAANRAVADYVLYGR